MRNLYFLFLICPLFFSLKCSGVANFCWLIATPPTGPRMVRSSIHEESDQGPAHPKLADCFASNSQKILYKIYESVLVVGWRNTLQDKTKFGGWRLPNIKHRLFKSTISQIIPQSASLY